MTLPHRILFALAFVLAGFGTARGAEPIGSMSTRNVVLVTTDGLRWQEVFRGADEALLNERDGGVANVGALRREFWRDTPAARRKALLPFIWGTIAREGQIFGNADQGSVVRVTNGRNFSYPGYNEILTGAPDDRINSNDKRPNPNATVFEWLNRKPEYRGKIAAVCSWDVFPYILNSERSGVPVNAGWMTLEGEALTPEQVALNRRMVATPRVWQECRLDELTFAVALEQHRREQPRVFYIALGDTDEHAHSGRYDSYLRAARRFDDAVDRLWDDLQSRPDYRGTTTLILTTDHGRGDPPRGWRDHGAKTPGSDLIWIAVLGPDTPALGERTQCGLVTQSQVAATIAALLGEDFGTVNSRAARPIGDVIRPGSGSAPIPPR